MLSKTGFTHSDLLCCQRDIHRSVNGVFKGDEAHWTNQMIDPAALLLPRIPRSRPSSARALVHLMHFLRIGLSVMHLLRCDMPTGSGINAILYDITHSTETETLRERIAEITVQCLPATDKPSRQLVDKLVDLHCALRTQDEESTNDK